MTLKSLHHNNFRLPRKYVLSPSQRSLRITIYMTLYIYHLRRNTTNTYRTNITIVSTRIKTKTPLKCSRAFAIDHRNTPPHLYARTFTMHRNVISILYVCYAALAPLNKHSQFYYTQYIIRRARSLRTLGTRQ